MLKKNVVLLFIIFLMVVGVSAIQADSIWQTVGTAGFSAGQVYHPAIALDSSGTPYVVYGDSGNSGKATVMMFNGASWETVGTAGFSAGSIARASIVLDDSDTPYVAYSDYGNSGKATVMMFNGASWETVGTARLFSRICH